LLLVPAAAVAQRGGQSGGTQPAPLPLSGRGTNVGSAVVAPGPTGGAGGASTPSVQAQGPLAGSAGSRNRRPFSGTLTLPDAIERGLSFNLGALNLAEAVKQSRGQRLVARSALLPSIAAELTDTLQKVNLAAFGLQFNAPIAGLTLPTVVGPFNNVDYRA